MKKAIILTFILIAVAAFFTGCGKAELTSAPADTATSDEITQATKQETIQESTQAESDTAVTSVKVGEIKTIYYCEYGIGYKAKEYKIDLDQGKVFEYLCPEYSKERDADAENEGYELVKVLTKNDVGEFLGACEKYGFTSWQSEYINSSILDGHMYDFEITLYNGTVKRIIGRNAYPNSWYDMEAAFEKLTGCNMMSTRISVS